MCRPDRLRPIATRLGMDPDAIAENVRSVLNMCVCDARISAVSSSLPSNDMMLDGGAIQVHLLDP